MVCYHITPAGNLPSILSAGLIPAIGPRSARFGEPLPAVYLFRSISDAEDALVSWLGEEMADEGALAMLSVDVCADLRCAGTAFETQVFNNIPAASISVMSTDLDCSPSADVSAGHVQYSIK